MNMGKTVINDKEKVIKTNKMKDVSNISDLVNNIECNPFKQITVKMEKLAPICTQVNFDVGLFTNLFSRESK